MKKYFILIISLVVSIVIFFIMLKIEQNILDKNQIVNTYILNKNINQWEQLSKEDLIPIFINKENVNENKYFTDLNQIQDLFANKDINIGNVLTLDMFVSENELASIKTDNNMENIVIKLEETNEKYSRLINNNTIVKLYITLNKNYIETLNLDYSNVLMELDEDKATVLYIENVKVVEYLDELGNGLNDNNILTNIIIRVTKEQALFINNIKDNAKFNITIM